MTRALNPNRAKPSIALLLSLAGFILVAAAIGNLFAVDPPPTGKPYGLEVRPWEAAWSAVFDHEVDAAGRVDFGMSASDRASLKQIVAFVALADPKSAPTRFPTRAAQLAYYINAY